MYGNPHVSKLSMWNYVDRTAKKFCDEYLKYSLAMASSIQLMHSLESWVALISTLTDIIEL